jgi:hypothetical protein
MRNTSEEDPKPDGAAFDEYFESLGKKAERLTINEQNEKLPNAKLEPANEDQRVVDEVESLCMNCHENVPCPQSQMVISANQMIGNHTTTPYPNTFLPGDYHHVLLLLSLQFQELRNSICRRDTAEGV